MSSEAVALANANAWIHARIRADAQLKELVRELPDFIEQNELREPQVSESPEAS